MWMPITRLWKLSIDSLKTKLQFLGITNTVTEVKEEGQVEIKIHKPCYKRKKATIEIRRLTGHEYDVVEKVQNIITTMIDDYTYGQIVSKTMINVKGKTKYIFSNGQATISVNKVAIRQ